MAKNALDSSLAEPPGQESQLPQFIALLLGSVCAIEYAVQQNQGLYLKIGVQALALGLVLLILGALKIELGFLNRWSRSRIGLLVVAALVFHLLLLVSDEPGVYITEPGNLKIFRLAVISLTIAGVAGLAARPVLGRWHAPLILVAFVVAGSWVLVYCTNPGIDAFTMQQESSKALLQGLNPWAITYPNIYHSSAFHPPGFADAERILLGYGYPPITLLMVVPSYLVSGDHRWAQLASIVLTGAIFAYLRRGAWGILIAALFLSSPRIFQVVEGSWTEPLVVVILAAALYCAIHNPRAFPWVFGVFLSSKQHMIIFAPAALLLLPQPLRWGDVWRFYARAIGIAAAIIVPFFLWDPAAFWHSVVKFQLQYHPRGDSLSFATYLINNGYPTLPRFTSLGLVILAYVLMWWRAPRTPVGFGLAVSFVALVCFAFDQAFLNRYYFVIAAVYMTLAAIPASQTDALLGHTADESPR